MWDVLLLVSLMFNLLFPVLGKMLPNMLYKLWDVSLLPYLWLFIMGVFVCEHFDTMVPFMCKWWYIGACLLLLQAFTGADIPGEYGVSKTLLQCFTWLGFAYANPKLNVKRDISYGIFLYHMVVVNVFIQLGYIGSWYYFMAVMLIVGVTAVLLNMLCSKKFYTSKTKQ